MPKRNNGKHGCGHRLLSKNPEENRHYKSYPKDPAIKITSEKIKQRINTP